VAMNDEQYFVMYTNYPVIENLTKYKNFLKTYNVPGPWGKTYKPGIRYRRLTLDSAEIENQRNLLFQEVLTAIANGKSLREIVGLGEISQEVNKTEAIVSYKLTTDAKGNETYIRSEHIGSITQQTGSEFLFKLACHSLIFFLSVKGNSRRIKRCPYCKLFFIAKDAKRKICYERICKNKYHKHDMESRREKDVVKYC